ncbi:MAG TPA: OsmC family protein [Trichococcus flocculiformis]|nr:OsmC family protein [Trichococcus flocculiformis]
MPNQLYKVTSTSLHENYQVINKARGKSIVLDEPEAFGGTDIGLSPVEALLAGLGSCKAIAGRMFAEKLGIKLHELEIEVSGNLNTDGFWVMRTSKSVSLTFTRHTASKLITPKRRSIIS